MKIFRIVSCLNEGSIGRTAEQLSNMVLERGWDSYIAYSRINLGSTSRTYRIDTELSTYWHALLTRLFDMCGYGSYFSTKKLVREIRHYKPDVIHMHIIHNYDINLKVLFNYLAKANIPIVWTQHDCWSYTGHCAFYSKIGCEKWKTQCNHCPLYKSFPQSWFYDGSRRNFNFKKKLFTSVPENLMKIIAVSEFVKKDLEESFLKKYEIIRIYNAIDTDVFFPRQNESFDVRAKYGFGDKTILMALATSWSERKGLSDYYKLREKLDEKYLIVLVGVNDDLREKLPAGIIGVRNTSSVDELVKLYSTASIIMNLASEESFGKTTPEGLSCGTPSIVYNCTASPELIDDKTGRIVEKGDLDGVVRAIEEIMNWDKAKTIDNCRNRVLQLFAMNKNWNDYLDLYKSLANNKDSIK